MGSAACEPTSELCRYAALSSLSTSAPTLPVLGPFLFANSSASLRSRLPKEGFNGDGAVVSYLKNITNDKPCSTMTPYLIATREGMIWWVTLTLMPVEVVFDRLEDEIERRRVSP